jgi:anthranilate 1,2-dioxygenase reductase subunit
MTQLNNGPNHGFFLSLIRRREDLALVGKKVWLKLPFGSFYFENDGRHKVLIAGGTGITPFVSFLEYAVDTDWKSPIDLYYGVRRPGLIIYDSLLDECKRKIKHFRVIIFTEQDAAVNSSYEEGRLDIDKIFESLQERNVCQYYLSGPLEMIRNFKSILIRNKIKESNILIDDWG